MLFRTEVSLVAMFARNLIRPVTAPSRRRSSLIAIVSSLAISIPFGKVFEGKYFGVPGWRVLRKGERDPYVDVDFILGRFSLEELPKFNGGIYYFTRSPESARLFETAQELLADYKELRFPEFRNDVPADEAILSVAMALHGLSPTSMGRKGMWTPISSRGPLDLDIVLGTCSFEKEGHIVYPDVVHFEAGIAVVLHIYVNVKNCDCTLRVGGFPHLDGVSCMFAVGPGTACGYSGQGSKRS